MIKKPNELKFKDKKIRVLIAGFPGIGKTTLALSAPKPLYIDVDLSAERIDPAVLNQAVGVIQPKDYSELRTDLGMGASQIELQNIKRDLEDCETLVVDTGGKLLTLMGLYGQKIDPKYGQRDGSLSLKGYGWLEKEFQRFLDHCIYELDKHICIVFHAVEDKDGDDTKLRIKAEGSSKNTVWETMDLGGFMEMRGNDRTIGFSNCERYFAKGTRGVHGVYRLPELRPGQKNVFLTQLFSEYSAKTEAEQTEAAIAQSEYDAAMIEGKRLIASITDAASANLAMAPFKAIKHNLTSSKELGVLWNDRIKETGLIFDSILGKYTPTADRLKGGM